MKMPYLETPRLLLRPLSVMDATSVFRYACDRDNTRFMLWGYKNSQEDVEAFLEKCEAECSRDVPCFYEFAVVLLGMVIGAAGLYLNENRTEAELGYILHKDFHGKGYATEVASALRDFAFDVLAVRRLVAHCDVRNTASFNVMKKIGMTLVSSGTKRVYPKTGEKSTEIMCVLSST